MRYMRKTYPILCLIFTLGIMLCLNTTTTMAETTTDADIATVKPNPDNTELTISYILDTKKELLLKTTEADVIDLNSLRKEIGSNNVVEDSAHKEFKLTLDDPSKIDFKLLVNNKKPFTLSVSDTDNNLIFDYDINTPEKDTRDLDDDQNNAEEASWTNINTMRISEGPILDHTDGTSTRAYLYFGDYKAAIKKTSLEKAFYPKGDSRTNSLTAPNSAILYAEKGSRILDGPDAPQNHIYTSHFGDNQSDDRAFWALPVENQPFGSPNSFTYNNLFNYVKKTDNWLRPGTSGPDKWNYSYAMLEQPKLYYRINQETGFEEQRIIFKQRAFWANKKGRDNPEITTTIKMSFTPTGKVITNMTFKNTGKYTFNNFSAFSNHDLSLNKDGKEIEDVKGKKIGNYIPMRSLGNRRGMYIQSLNNEVRTSFYMNLPKGPKAWAARSISKSYVATKGFMANAGLIGIGYSSERYYPWKSGKPKFGFLGSSNKFYNKKTNTYNSPYVPENFFNAFGDQHDPGDTYSKTKAGERLAVAEADPLWDSGVTMRSSPTDLAVNNSVQMEYATQTDVNGKTFNPVISMDHHGTNDNPQLLSLDQKSLPTTGQWYDFDSKDAYMYYSIDSTKIEDFKLLNIYHQTEQDVQNGSHHEMENSIDLKGLDKSKHKIRFVMVDNDGYASNVEEHIIKFIKPATVAPQIDITSPGSTSKEPFSPYDHDFAIKGVWSDKDNNTIQSITYKIDDEPEKIVAEDVNNPHLGKLNSGKLDKINIEKYNDLKLHKIKFKITDDDGNEGIDVFYFQHQPGATQLSAPAEIDFGSLTVSPNGVSPVKPQIKDGKVRLDDYRAKDSNPLGVSLSIDKFYKAKESNIDDNDDGDDSGLSGDPDRSETTKSEALVHDVYWKDQLVDTNNLLVGQTDGPKNDTWQQSTDFTDEVLDNLKINFRSNENGASNGKYVSVWKWQIVDSVQ